MTTEILTGYLLAESNFLVTNRPVIQTDIFVPTQSGFFADLWDSHQLYQPARLFSVPGDEVDLTGGWIGAVGPYLLKAQAAWWDIAGSHNNFGDAKATLSRSFGDWAPFISVEDQNILPRRKNFEYLHGGAEVGFQLFSVPFQERFTLSWEDRKSVV